MKSNGPSEVLLRCPDERGRQRARPPVWPVPLTKLHIHLERDGAGWRAGGGAGRLLLMHGDQVLGRRLRAPPDGGLHLLIDLVGVS